LFSKKVKKQQASINQCTGTVIQPYFCYNIFNFRVGSKDYWIRRDRIVSIRRISEKVPDSVEFRFRIRHSPTNCCWPKILINLCKKSRNVVVLRIRWSSEECLKFVCCSHDVRVRYQHLCEKWSSLLGRSIWSGLYRFL